MMQKPITDCMMTHRKKLCHRRPHPSHPSTSVQCSTWRSCAEVGGGRELWLESRGGGEPDALMTALCDSYCDLVNFFISLMFIWWEHASNGAPVEVRGQLGGVGAETQVTRLGDKLLCPLSQLTSPSYSDAKTAPAMQVRPGGQGSTT